MNVAGQCTTKEEARACLDAKKEPRVSKAIIAGTEVSCRGRVQKDDKGELVFSTRDPVTGIWTFHPEWELCTT